MGHCGTVPVVPCPIFLLIIFIDATILANHTPRNNMSRTPLNSLLGKIPCELDVIAYGIIFIILTEQEFSESIGGDGVPGWKLRQLASLGNGTQTSEVIMDLFEVALNSLKEHGVVTCDDTNRWRLADFDTLMDAIVDFGSREKSRRYQRARRQKQATAST